MGLNNNEFFVELGKRVARLRRKAGLTQSQLAEILECSQQHVLSFEKARCRIPANVLPVLAEVFGVTTDELLGIETKPSRPGPASKLEQQLERLSSLPRAKQRFVAEMLDGLLQQAS